MKVDSEMEKEERSEEIKEEWTSSFD